MKETDLGEWIIQLAGQRPSHMVMPAIHLTKEDVAEIFSKEVGERLATDIPRLVKVARKELRPAFLEADMGISGANIAVAETGTLVLVTNEGNARLVTTLPRIHVAIVGLEKLVPAFADVVPILTALPRSATGQLMTSYVSMITGAAPNTDGTPKELHIVLMDHRRTEMAADPVFKEALQCIRCASCLNVCPVYRHVGGHVFGDVYTGGIGTILTAWTGAMERSKEIQGLCIQCGNCVGVCPGKIDIPELIVEVRRRQVQDKGQPLRPEGDLQGRQQPAPLPLGPPLRLARPEAVREGRVRAAPAVLPLGPRRLPEPPRHRREAVPRHVQGDPAEEGDAGRRPSTPAASSTSPTPGWARTS